MWKNKEDDTIGIVVMFPKLSNSRVEDINGDVINEGLNQTPISLEKDSTISDAGKSKETLSEGNDSSDEEEGGTQNERNKRKMYRKREYVLKELLDTEKAYLQDLSQIVDGYMELVKNGEVEKPASLMGKEMVVFGNVHQIHDWHSKTFLPELERNLTNPRKLANTFIKHERKFDIYVKYCENKPKSEDLVSENLSYFEELRESLGQKFQLTDVLIKPVQRIMKYKLLFKDILKYTEKAGDDVKEIQKALEVMCVIPKAANNMMNVSRLQGFNGKVTAQGRLLLQNDLLISEETASKTPSKVDKSQFQNRRTFLFEQIIIFSEQSDRKKNPHIRPSYLYRNCIRVNKMALRTDVAYDAMAFILVNRAPDAQARFVCRASDAASKKNWVTQITLLMEMQNDFLKALQSPIEYQNEWKDNSQTNSLVETSVEKVDNPDKIHKSSKHNKSKSRSFRNLFIRQSSVQNDRSNDRSKGNLSLAIEQNISQTTGLKDASADPKTSAVHTEASKSKWSLLRKKSTKNNTPSTSPFEDNSYLEGLKDNNFSTPENHINCKDIKKRSIHSSMNNLLSSDRCSSISKSTEGRKSSLLDNSESSNGEEAFLNVNEETEEDIAIVPKTAGVVWNNLRMLFKRPSTTTMPAKIVSKDDFTPVGNRKVKSQISKESIKEKSNAPVFLEELENATAIDKSHVTLVCKVTCTQPLQNQNDINNPSKKHFSNTLEVISNKIDENSNKNDNKTQITWLNPQDEVISNSLKENVECRQIETNQFECRLTLYNISTTQSGVYKCQASNSQGVASSEATLKICPEIKSKPRMKVNAALNEKLNARLSCLTSSLASSSSSLSHLNYPKNKKRFDQIEIDQLRWSQGFDEKFTEVSLIHQNNLLTVLKKLVNRKNYTEVVVGKFCSRFFRSKESVWKETILNNSFDHQSLVKVLEIFEINSGYVSIHPYIEHGRLFDYIQSIISDSQHSTSFSNFTDTLALQLSTQLFSALNCLHSRNIVHLKINPENLLIDLTEPTQPSIKVIDFSHARQLDATTNDPCKAYVHSFSGDAEFTAPEILQHFAVTCYADIWSAGVVLYTMLTGDTPFHRQDMQRTCQAVVDTSYHLENIPNESTRKLLQSIFTMPPSQRLSGSMCYEKCRLLSTTFSPTSLPISPTLLKDFLTRRALM